MSIIYIECLPTKLSGCFLHPANHTSNPTMLISQVKTGGPMIAV